MHTRNELERMTLSELIEAWNNAHQFTGDYDADDLAARDRDTAACALAEAAAELLIRAIMTMEGN